MGHHPSPGSATNVVNAGSGLSPSTWMFILAGIAILGMVLYYIYNKKK